MKPGWCALLHGADCITYGRLWSAAAALAHQLRGYGIGREDVVAVCLPRSPEQIVAALAAMQAGAAYLPIDPAHPQDRLEFIVRDAEADVLIASDDICAAVGGNVRHCVAATAWRGAHAPVAPPDVDLRADDLAYVIYTSGSTGTPKGVEITHAALANLVDWHVDEFAVRAGDRASHLAPVGFDAAAWEVWPYLAAGATVCIADDAVAQDPEMLFAWLGRNAITHAFAAAPLAERLLRFSWPAAATLRVLLTGADRLHAYPPARLPFSVVNNYGPTEAAIVATSGRVAPCNAPAAYPSIGKPIRNVHVYVVDAAGRRVAAGVEGEFWIGGRGIARGYRNRPEETAAAFGPDPFDATPSARIFRSGDRGRVLPGGELEFGGRSDAQLKVRGYRVEPAEIEGRLAEHDAIVASAVVAHGAGEDARLIAYVVAPGRSVALRELRDFLARALPAYMIPAAFVRVACLPLTGNGKVDRAALSDIEPQGALVDAAHVAPRTATQAQIATIVEPLLKLDALSIDDNIFMLGGHSLLGTQILARIRDAFGVRLSLRFLFESPTVAALAAEVDRAVALTQRETLPLTVAAKTA